MTPKKPTMTVARKAWMQSLKAGDEVLCWSRHYFANGWFLVTVAPPDDSNNVRVRILQSGSESFVYVPRGSGCSTQDSKPLAVIFPRDNKEAWQGLQLDNIRRALRKRIWFDVSDSAIERIAEVVRIDDRKKEFIPLHSDKVTP